MLKRIGHWILDYSYLFRGKAHPIWRHSPPAHYLGYVLARKRPVILLPGIMGTWHFLKFLGDALSHQGHPVYVVKELRFSMGEVPVLAEIVGNFIKKHDLQNVVLLGHSKGGLVGKYILAFFNGDHWVKKLIAVATPFKGSHFVKFIPNAKYRELRPESVLINQLDARKDVNPKIVSIYGVWDNYIWPTESTRLDGAKNIQVPIHGHHRILFSEQVRDIIIQEVNS